ncbi:gp6 [Bacillus phage G]|uniref:Gp6 n=1 Tax=Bacillus phage G TaxID=2884420 RepID=G3MB76_9CAUD|nr:gp6 [Bacillus phage G]AEO93277.1 gp6 [Bacillus phage G]
MPVNIVEVYSIWKIFVEYENNEVNEAYVVISADNIIDGYKKGEWQRVEYRGFYLTFEEAKNEINGYLE